MRKTNNPQTALGFSLLNWFVVLCAPEPGKELFVGEYTREDKQRWVREPAGRPWLAIRAAAQRHFYLSMDPAPAPAPEGRPC